MLDDQPTVFALIQDAVATTNAIHAQRFWLGEDTTNRLAGVTMDVSLGLHHEVLPSLVLDPSSFPDADLPRATRYAIALNLSASTVRGRLKALRHRLDHWILERERIADMDEILRDITKY